MRQLPRKATKRNVFPRGTGVEIYTWGLFLWRVEGCCTQGVEEWWVCSFRRLADSRRERLSGQPFELTGEVRLTFGLGRVDGDARLEIWAMGGGSSGGAAEASR